MGRKEENIKKAQVLMHETDHIRNIGTAAHIDHGKTTFSDNLIAGAGMMSEELAGHQLVLDYDEQEQDRGITINAAAVSMVHEFDDDEFLINLFDTPGHVDFGGDVTRAMRAIDGCIVLVDAVEGIMPQTETVIRQALRENVRPVLFINKVDRMINELKVDPDEMQQQFAKVIASVNELIKKMTPEDLDEDWRVSAEGGTVAFGSALYNWAISVPYMKQTGVTFKDIYDHLEKEEVRELIKKAPLHEVALNMVVRHLPAPTVAQGRRIPNIWRGDMDSEVGKAMIAVDENGPLSFMVTKIIMDPHAGEVAVGRVFSGKIQQGQRLNVVGMPERNRVQQVGIMVGADRIPVDEVDAGNLAAVTGLKDAIAGSTVTDLEEMVPFERIVHVSEPVVTVAVEAKHTKDLPKLVEVLRTISKADPSIQVTIDQETGQHLMSGMGELHLEVTQHRIEKEQGIPITSSEPIVVYRETIIQPAGPFEGKSPNKHNKFYVEVAPLSSEIVTAIKEGEFDNVKIKKGEKEMAEAFQELGMHKDKSKDVVAIEGPNVLVDASKGVQYLHETMELVVDSFREAMQEGPRTREPVQGVEVRLVDAKLHEDAIHRGPAQTIPAVRQAIHGAMTQAGVTLFEPMQKVFISVPQDVMGGATSELGQRRATIEEMGQEGDMSIIEAKAPVAEMFGFASAIRSATSGRCLWSTENTGFETLPQNLLEEITREVRERKGLSPEPPGLAYYSS